MGGKNCTKSFKRMKKKNFYDFDQIGNHFIFIIDVVNNLVAGEYYYVTFNLSILHVVRENYKIVTDLLKIIKI